MMELMPPVSVTQPAPIPAPQQVIVPPTKPVSPIEPSRRVTANREGGRSDLAPQEQSRGLAAGSPRGRLIDVSV
jgi:hypothetical protein